MCFRIPGRIVEIDGDNDQLARVDVDGSLRDVSLSMISEDGPEVGDHVLIHMGVAVELIDEARAEEVKEGLQLVGRAQEQALEDLERSWMSKQRPDTDAEQEQDDGRRGRS